MKRILIVEDEQDLADLLAFNLQKEGYRTSVAHDGISGLEAALRDNPDLILLDVMLPGMNGIEVCKQLHRERATADTPVIMLTAKGEEIDRVVGFEVGVEDYVVKPFSTRELLLRIKALLRRTASEPATEDLLDMGPLRIDTERHLVTVEGEAITLTTTEYKLLLFLVERRGRVQSRDSLLSNIWGYACEADTRTVDTHVTRLRNKLGAAGELIRTVRGFGYKLEE